MGIEGVRKGGMKKPPRIGLYGSPGIGKTSWAASAPSPILITTEDGADNLKVDQFPRAETWEKLVANIEAVVKAVNGYKTLVLDTLNGAADLAAAHVCATQFKGDWGEKGFQAFGRGWSSTANEMKKLLPLLDTARAQGMTIVLLAHTGVINIKNPIEGDYTRYAPDMNKNVWAQFAAWLDIVVRAEYEFVVIKAGKPGTPGRAQGTSTRILRCQGSVVEDVKTRVGYELPEVLPLSWPAFADALGTASDVLEQVKALWHLLTKEEQMASLKWLGGDLAKAGTDKLKQVLARLNKRSADLAAASVNVDDREVAHG